VLVRLRATVIAGLAKLVDEVDGQDQPEGGDRLAHALAETGAGLDRQLERREAEHQVCRPRPENSERELGGDVSRGVGPTKLVAGRGDEADRRVHVGARNRPEHGDQDEQDCAGGEGVGEERDRRVSARQALGHDARADDAREQEERAERFGCKSSAKRARFRLQWHRSLSYSARRGFAMSAFDPSPSPTHCGHRAFPSPMK
jgi:hypothetical protein